MNTLWTPRVLDRRGHGVLFEQGNRSDRNARQKSVMILAACYPPVVGDEWFLQRPEEQMIRKLYQFAFLIPFVIAGCGRSGPELARVQGLVTLDGVAVKEGSVQFWPDTGRPARASIAEDGTYQLTTFKPNDGAYVGQHRVTIKATKLASPDPDPEIESTQAEIEHFRKPGVKRIRASRVVWVIPRKYAEVDTSPLSAMVESGSNEINFDIKDE